MEILNQRKRNTAILRLLGLIVLALAFMAMSVLNTQSNYANQGQEELTECQRSTKQQIAQLEAARTKLQNDIKQARLELERCRSKRAEENPEIPKTKMLIKDKKEQIKDLKKRNKQYQKDLNKCLAKKRQQEAFGQ
ncbi:MAG: hypothetical protein AAF828_00670 [Bacteroidota bacterium]